ncbi:hypothetical protein ABT275_45050 [Streptomyces sp. NPDC001185]|uniref:hypothetical protein n=1 Tax=Streptomyces sp. NPDC001185 TaxID=3154380 RepID=UPI0033282A6A
MFKIALRGPTAAALLTVPLPTTAIANPTLHVASMPLTTAVDLLPITIESRDSHQHSTFRHWVDADRDSCNTRTDVLITETRVAPTVDAGCKVTAGEWYSYYDGVTVTTPGGLDIDHEDDPLPGRDRRSLRGGPHSGDQHLLARSHRPS